MTRNCCAPSRAEIFKQIPAEYKEKAKDIEASGLQVPPLYCGDMTGIDWCDESTLERWCKKVDEVHLSTPFVLVENWPVREAARYEDHQLAA